MLFNLPSSGYVLFQKNIVISCTFVISRPRIPNRIASCVSSNDGVLGVAADIKVVGFEVLLVGDLSG